MACLCSEQPTGLGRHMVWRSAEQRYAGLYACRWLQGHAQAIDCLRLTLHSIEELWRNILAGLCGWLDDGSSLRISIVDRGMTPDEQSFTLSSMSTGICACIPSPAEE